MKETAYISRSLLFMVDDGRGHLYHHHDHCVNCKSIVCNYQIHGWYKWMCIVYLLFYKVIYYVHLYIERDISIRHYSYRYMILYYTWVVMMLIFSWWWYNAADERLRRRWWCLCCWSLPYLPWELISRWPLSYIDQLYTSCIDMKFPKLKIQVHVLVYSLLFGMVLQYLQNYNNNNFHLNISIY